MNNNPAFIYILLCDNDFGVELEQAAKIIYEQFRNYEIFCSEERVKRSVIKLIDGLNDMCAASNGFEVICPLSYLRDSLTVQFTDKLLTLDHDGGSVAIDRNTGYIWRV